MIVNVNGRVTDEKAACISVLDHGFLFGEGVYEVVRTYNRVPFLLDRHLQRLRRSAGMIRLPLPFTDAEFEAEIRRTIAAYYDQPDGPGGDVYIRTLVTRGVGDTSYDPSRCGPATVVIIVKPHEPPPASAYEDGVSIAIVPIVRNHPGSVNPLIKSNNLLNNALAAQEALRRGAFEGVMHNYRGEIAEGSTSNLFVVRRGTAATPPLDCGLLAGITRGFVGEVAAAAGVPLEEAVLHDGDVLNADEAFLTSSTREIVPVVRVDDRVLGNGRPGPITRRLLGVYREKLREITGASASR